MNPDLQNLLDHPAVKAVSAAAATIDIPCYAVGGCVRDALLHRHSKDIDFVCVGPGSGIAVAKQLRASTRRASTVHIYSGFGTAQVKLQGLELEFVGARRESYSRDSRKPIVEDGTLADDLSRRDFTINALALSVNAQVGEPQLIDLFGGVDDLHRGIIRTPLDPDITYSDDPLRMLRAIRFATQLNFTIEEESLKAIARNADRISIISRERITSELNKIMLSPRPSIGWRLLAETGLLRHFLPELVALQGVETVQGRGHKDNFDHTMLVLDRVAQAEPDKLWLHWAALLHDIAKPATKRWDAQTGWTFKNHDFAGSKMVARIFRNLKMPLGEPMKYTQKIVRLHMRPIALVEDTVTDSAIRRLVTDSEGDLDDLMTLCRADITSRNPEKVKRHLANFENVIEKINDVADRDNLRNFQPPVDGAEIMATFGLSPSPIVGELKSALKEAVLEGIIPNEHDAARRYLLQLGAEKGLTPTGG